MRNKGILLPRFCLVLVCAWAAPLAAQDLTGIPFRVSADLVASDSARRLVVVRDSKGAELTYQMDDLLGGTPGVKAGDPVILTLRGGSGVQRVSAIAHAKSPSPAGLAARKDAGAVPAKGFARQVAMLSRDARPVDVLWLTFVRDCDVQPFSQNDGRAWFGLWDGRVRADFSTGPCRDIFNRMVEAGELIKQDMVAAEEAARKALSPGEIREIRRSHLMEWDGWALAPPPRREP